MEKPTIRKSIDRSAQKKKFVKERMQKQIGKWVAKVWQSSPDENGS